MKAIFEYIPNPNFLLAIATVEAAILAFLIPLSFEMITKISERYQSEVVSEPFRRELVNRVLPICLIYNIVMAVVLIYFDDMRHASILWQTVAQVSLLIFLSIAVMIAVFIDKLKSYMTNIDIILDKLFDEAENYIQ